jgi:BRCA1-associated protein
MAKWMDSRCPVCRFVQDLSHDDEEDNHCNVCDTNKDLWICLICGHVGCGRYEMAHAKKHYHDSQHTFAMEVETQRVWDYVGDGYVHRIVQHADGKLIELNEDQNGNNNNSHNNANASHTSSGYPHKDNAKMNAVDFMLWTQLEAQRKFFEEKLDRATTDLATAASTSSLQEKALCDMKKKVSDGEKEIKALTKRVADLSSQLDEKNGMHQLCLSSIKEWETKYKNLEAASALKTKELQEQIRDLMFFLDSQEKLKNNADAADGSIVIDNSNVDNGTSSSSSSSSGRTPSKKSTPTKRK